MSLALAAKNGLLRARAPSASNGIAIVADLRHVAANVDAVVLAQPLLGDRRRRRPPARSAAPRRGRRRADRAGRTCAGRCSRRGRGGRCRRCCRSPCCAGRCCGSAARSACRWSCLRTRRRGSRPCRPRCRCVTWREVPGGAGRARAGCRPRTSAMPGGQPSITQPIAGPWLSPKVVTRRDCRRCCRTCGVRLRALERNHRPRAMALEFGGSSARAAGRCRRGSSTGQSRM